jgi:predicted acyl esterase
MHPLFRGLTALALVTVAAPASAQTQAPRQWPYGYSQERADSIRSHYTKYEYRIPMRDGVKLFTSVYVPNDARADKRYPLLMVRTPYTVAPYGVDRYPRGAGAHAGL